MKRRERDQNKIRVMRSFFTDMIYRIKQISHTYRIEKKKDIVKEDNIYHRVSHVKGERIQAKTSDTSYLNLTAIAATGVVTLSIASNPALARRSFV